MFISICLQILYKIQEVSRITEEIMHPSLASPLKTATLRCSLKRVGKQKCVYVCTVCEKLCMCVYFFKFSIFFSVIKAGENQKGFYYFFICPTVSSGESHKAS